MRRSRPGGWRGRPDPFDAGRVRRGHLRPARRRIAPQPDRGSRAAYRRAPLQLDRHRRVRPRQLPAASTMIKRLIFALLGKDPEAVVVSFWTGPDALVLRMIEEIRGLVPDRDHYVVSIGPKPAPAGCVLVELPAADLYLHLRRALRRKR